MPKAAGAEKHGKNVPASLRIADSCQIVFAQTKGKADIKITCLRDVNRLTEFFRLGRYDNARTLAFQPPFYPACCSVALSFAACSRMAATSADSANCRASRDKSAAVGIPDILTASAQNSERGT